MVERACDERGQSGFVYATRRFYAQAPQLLSGANFDLAGAHRVSKQGCANEVSPSITLPSSTAKRQPCHGHFTLSPSNFPFGKWATRCEQVSASAKILPSRFTSIAGISPAMALHILQSGNSFPPSRAGILMAIPEAREALTIFL
jgi:hypothetical protein